MRGMNHDELLAQEEIHRAHIVICRERRLNVEESIRALADQAASQGVRLHVAALGVLGLSAAGSDLSRRRASVETHSAVDVEASRTRPDQEY
jgi:hypothetical protein